MFRITLGGDMTNDGDNESYRVAITKKKIRTGLKCDYLHNKEQYNNRPCERAAMAKDDNSNKLEAPTVDKKRQWWWQKTGADERDNNDEQE